ncbi:MAG: hypothetical protein QG656_1800, partial [Candidatus Hydrogenedentes bacterium]|nr:hypothetical protein [Candidatus Hydrogenedentota bacterium]
MPKRLGRRAFLGTLAAGAASFGLVRAEETTARRKPNVLYLFSDEHRYQSMSCTEMPELKTPNMARLAKDGVSFTHCISNYPVCSPHRAILMTGRWPFQQGVIDNGIDLNPNEMTLGKAFKAAGYKTGYIGKWHLGGTRAEPFGFDESLIWTGDNVHWDKAQYHPKEGGPIQPKGYNATLMTDQALAFIEENADKDEPFFLMVSWNPPHSNFIDAPEDKKALYPEGSLPFRPNYESDKTDPEARKIWDDNGWAEYRGYHAHITAIDEELGRILAKLDETGIAGGTIVVYSADHGSMFGSHGVGSKRQPFDESIRVPFLVCGPGITPAGRTCGNLFGTIDVMPTLCGLAEIPVPDSCMGQDFSHFIRKAHFRFDQTMNRT